MTPAYVDRVPIPHGSLPGKSWFNDGTTVQVCRAQTRATAGLPLLHLHFRGTGQFFDGRWVSPTARGRSKAGVKPKGGLRLFGTFLCGEKGARIGMRNILSRAGAARKECSLSTEVIRCCYFPAAHPKGCFLIWANLRGYFFGVGPALSMITSRCSTSVPGMV